MQKVPGFFTSPKTVNFAFKRGDVEASTSAVVYKAGVVVTNGQLSVPVNGSICGVSISPSLVYLI